MVISIIFDLNHQNNQITDFWLMIEINYFKMIFLGYAYVFPSFIRPFVYK